MTEEQKIAKMLCEYLDTLDSRSIRNATSNASLGDLDRMESWIESMDINRANRHDILADMGDDGQHNRKILMSFMEELMERFNESY